MKSIFLKAICAFCFLSVSVNANAGLLSVNGSEVNALDINKSLVSTGQAKVLKLDGMSIGSQSEKMV